MLSAGRVQVDFWDPEGGYYLNGTYYGEKNLLAIGVAGQVQGSDNGARPPISSSRRSCRTAARFTIEASTPTTTGSAATTRTTTRATGGYVLGSYLFPPAMGMTGKFEVLGKFAKANFTNGL